MAGITDYIRSLESYAERNGARLIRSALPEAISGRVSHDVITLGIDLNPEQQLMTLVHELAHWLAHRNIAVDPSRTVLEYEAEAVEAVVGARLGLPHSSDPGDDHDPTDDLLSASVARVMWASRRICDALGI